MLIDFHTHSCHTLDVPFDIGELATQAKKVDLDGFCLTDHHSVSGWDQAKQLGELFEIAILVGFEAITDRGHFLVFLPEPRSMFPLESRVSFKNPGLISYNSLNSAVQSSRGVMIAAHPYDRSRLNSPGDTIVQLPGISAVEVRHTACAPLACELAEELAVSVGWSGVGGSGRLVSLNDMGKSATLVQEPVQNEFDLIERILSCEVWPVSIGDFTEPTTFLPRAKPTQNNPHIKATNPSSRFQKPRRKSRSFKS